MVRLFSFSPIKWQIKRYNFFLLRNHHILELTESLYHKKPQYKEHPQISIYFSQDSNTPLKRL